MESSRWHALTKSQQLLNLAAEFTRAAVWQGTDEEKFRGTLARALALVDLCLSDSKWRGETRMLLGLRDEVAKFWTGESSVDIGVLSRCL